MRAMVSLCDQTGNMARPWAAAGYECWCVDIEHSIRRDRDERVGCGVIHFVWGDVRSWCPPAGLGIAFVAAFPPCTHLSGSGARDWKKKGHFLLTDALELWGACQMAASWSGAPYMIENPVGALSRHMRAPDEKFDPFEYAGYLDDPEAENTLKRTCLWTGGGFVMPERREAPAPHRQDCWRATPSPDRADVRSVTPMGFAEAVFLANAPAQRQQVAA